MPKWASRAIGNSATGRRQIGWQGAYGWDGMLDEINSPPVFVWLSMRGQVPFIRSRAVTNSTARVEEKDAGIITGKLHKRARSLRRFIGIGRYLGDVSHPRRDRPHSADSAQFQERFIDVRAGF